jgi:hypothetical protein
LPRVASVLVVSTDYKFLKDAMESQSPQPRESPERKRITDDVEIGWEVADTGGSADAFGVTFVIWIGENVVLPAAIGIVSKYLYDRLRPSKRKIFELKINGLDVRLKEGEINRVLIEQLTVSKEKT